MLDTDDIVDSNSIDGLAIGFKRHLAVPAIVFLLLEIIVVVLPLLSLFGDQITSKSIVLRIAIPVLIGSQVVWTALFWNWCRPLYRAILMKRRGESMPESVTISAYRALWKIPLRALALRSALWTTVVLAHGFFLFKYGGWEPRRALELTAMGTFHAVLCNLGRAVWLQFLMMRFRRRLFAKVSKLRCFSDGYFRALYLVSLASIGLTMASVAAFIYFFLPISLDQYLRIQTFFPIALALTGIGIWIYSTFTTREINRYLQSQTSEGKKGHSIAAIVYKNVQGLPYRLLLAFWGLWIVTAALIVILAKSAWHLQSDDAVILFGIVVVISVGSALYQGLWHREIVRPLLDHLTLQHRVPIRGIRTKLTLRVKLLLSFGVMVFFAVGMAFFWGFTQYKNLVTKSTASQADLGLAWVRSVVQAEFAAGETAPTAAVVGQTIKGLYQSGKNPAAVYYFIPTNEFGKGVQGVRSYGGGAIGTPQLPWYARAQMYMSADGTISLRAHSLSGRRGPLRVQWQNKIYHLGSVAVFYPTYRGRGTSLAGPLREMVLFFLLLFGVCAGIVVLTVAQFVKPIHRLELRADGMARGDLAEPVTSGAESDEVGRLTDALEEMRRVLRDKLRSTEEVNIDLERAVQRRTHDLAKKNRELAETLEKLTRAQDQLVQSEKMASIGQLVAGIAHEINNPVNAIVNTVGPLAESIDDLNSEISDIRQEAETDVKDMIRVVQRGAERTKAIVQALHNYSRADDESIVEVDLNRSLDDSLELLRHIFKNSIVVTRDYQEIGRVQGHAGQLNQVFMNLLTNAGQAVAGVDNASVRISTQVSGTGAHQSIVVSVEDNGKGMSSEILNRIFDPFFTTKDVGEGSGLGLSIVHGIVERHGGKIEVTSTPGAGTTFRVTLPRRGIKTLLNRP